MQKYHRIDLSCKILIAILSSIRCVLDGLYLLKGLDPLYVVWLTSFILLTLITISILILLAYSLIKIKRLSYGLTWKNPLIIHLTLVNIVVILVVFVTANIIITHYGRM